MVNAVDAAKRVFDIVDKHKNKSQDRNIDDGSRNNLVYEVTASVSIETNTDATMAVTDEMNDIIHHICYPFLPLFTPIFHPSLGTSQ